MKVDVDFSGLDDFLDEAKDEIKKGMVEVAREGERGTLHGGSF